MALLSEVKPHYGRLKLYINGQWVDSKSTETTQVTNPAKSEVIAELPSATGEEIEMAVAAAQSAFEKWRNVSLRDRARLMWDFRDKFDEHDDELSRILTQDHGRTIEESRGSVRRVIENIESACSAMYSINRGVYVDQLASGIDQYLLWEPLGVFLIIAPGNIPMHALSSFVPYALACGCTVVVSPSRQSPVATDATFRVMEEVGLPPGVFNLVHGGREVNKAILSHPLIKGVGFIGSSSTGRELFALAGKLGKSSSINGNGKNYVVVMPDADDLTSAVQWLLRACFGMSGQRCLGTDNVVVLGDQRRYQEVKSRFIEAAASMKLGYGLDEEAELGPLTTQGGKEKVESWIEKGVKEGAKILLDGREPRVEGYPDGYFLAPTILEGVTPEMSIAQDEAFGPVAGLMRAGNLDEVIHGINTTLGGHSSAIFTSSMKAARKFVREVDTGNVGVNVAMAQPYAFFPLGSRRDAFYGTAKSRIDSVRLFMDQKIAVQRWV